MKEILKKLRGDAIAYRPSFAKVVVGKDRFGAEGAIYLQQLIYWCDKGTRPDGFIYKSKDEIYEETGITPKVQDRIRRVLLSLNCLETKTLKANGAPTLHYKLNLEEIVKIFASDCADCLIGLRQRDDSIMPNGVMDYAQRVESITENTTENTQKITTSNDWQAIVLYFYNKISPEIDFSSRFRKSTKPAAVHLRSMYTDKQIRERIDILAGSPKKTFNKRFERFCENFSDFEPKTHAPAVKRQTWDGF